ADGRAARLVDRLLDFLLVGVLLGAPLIFYTRGYDVFEFNKITAVRVLTTLAAGLMLFKLLFVRPLNLLRSALDVPVLVWLLVCLACTFHTVNWRLSTHGVYEDFEGITTWVMYVFLFWWPLQHVRTERQIRLIFGAVVLAGTVAGFYGLLQNFGIDFVPWNPSTYNPDRMFSTMGNPDFLAAYTVMSMPITLIFFLDLPARIRTDKAFCTILVVASVFVSAFLALLFNVDYFNFTVPASQGLLGFGITKLLIAFPVICAVLLYMGRLRLILLLSLAGQLTSTLFTKSRGGVFAMAAILVLLVCAGVFEVFGASALFSVTGLVCALGGAGAIAFFFYSGLWQNTLDFLFVQHPVPSFVVFLGLLVCLHFLIKRRGQGELLSQSVDYVLGLMVTVWGLFFIPAIRLATFQMLERFSKLFHPSQVRITPRLFIWRAALRMLRDNFAFGTGLDTFQISFPPYREALYWILEWNGTPEKAHNYIMQTAATMGFAGLLAFAWMHTAWIGQSFRDWRRQKDESRRLLLLGGFAAWLGFAVQNLFSFTVVGYGSLWWILWGLMPAMQYVWEKQDGGSGSLVLAQPDASVTGWNGPRGAWSGGVAFLGTALVLCAAAGPTFFDSSAYAVLGTILALVGFTCLIWALVDGPEAPGLRAWVLLGVAGIGVFVYSLYSVKIWVADSFYKQGQVGMNANQLGYAVMAYEKAAGQIVGPLTAEQQANIVGADAGPRSQWLTIKPGLNPDQELYWVKLGIAFEAAAQEETDAAKKLQFYQTALTVHQHTLEMNPINGYNYNNKGRVLKAMGEGFGQKAYLEEALANYQKAIALDKNNVYFCIDEMQTYLDLGRVNDAYTLCVQLIRKFPDFAVPYSYAGFMKMKAGQTADAIQLLTRALDSDWKGDTESEALAAVNLGRVYDQQKDWTHASEAYAHATQVNPQLPDSYLNLSADEVHLKQRGPAVDTLRALLKAVPGQANALAALKKLGATP
ncbi:MAG: O-antigen ligase family protein, partial [bacterium]